jgi:hypothetical protein
MTDLRVKHPASFGLAPNVSLSHSVPTIIEGEGRFSGLGVRDFPLAGRTCPQEAINGDHPPDEVPVLCSGGDKAAKRPST